ncbi:MAG: DUF1801 domain-containing protein, partial [Bacteroidota bacterium]
IYIMVPFKESAVERKFLDFDKLIREKLLILREIIFEVANQNEEIGELTEALRWSQPSYIPKVTNSGTLIRLDKYYPKKDHFAIYFHCQTNLIWNFKKMFPQLNYAGNRAIFFSVNDKIPKSILKRCFYKAFTYKINKK